MKTLFLSILVVITLPAARANPIDSLQTIADVNAFIKKNVKFDWKIEVFLPETPADTPRFGLHRFFKLDLDGNGRTDLLINDEHLLAILDEGDSRYTSHFIVWGQKHDRLHKRLSRLIDQPDPMLVIQRYNAFFSRIINGDTIHRKEVTDSLIYRYGNFIEYNARPDDWSIQKIILKTSYCFGDCPSFDLEIQTDRSAVFKSHGYNNLPSGVYKGVIDSTTFNNLVGTIRYMQLASLKDRYSIFATDHSGADLEIWFANGLVKKVDDYGMEGTYSLKSVYAQMFDLRETQEWTRQ